MNTSTVKGLASGGESLATEKKGFFSSIGGAIKKVIDTIVGWLPESVRGKLQAFASAHGWVFYVLAFALALVLLFRIDNPVGRWILESADPYLSEGCKKEGLIGAFFRLLAKLLKAIAGKNFGKYSPATAVTLSALQAGIGAAPAYSSPGQAFAFDF